MQFIVDTATHRHAYGERRVLFSWASFYAGVAVAMGMMLIAYKALPPESRAARPQRPSVAVASSVQSAAVEPVRAVTASSIVLAIEAASPNASNRGASVALEHLRWRGAELLNALDREYAALAVMELMGKTRGQAEAIVGAWATP